MNADGTNLANLTNAPSSIEGSPTYSPDGSKIAFVSNRDTLDGNNLDEEIYVINADGSNQTNLTNTLETVELQPDWQPIPVVYSFSGFYQPVDNLPTLNKTKPGKTIPIRFGLGGDKGLDVFATGYPRSEAIDCETGAPTDDVEQTVLGKSGLTYDPVSDRYTYNWATSSSWSGCRQFVMTLKDGTVQRAHFIFK
jgi:dipeptidyl aminopeptidase/acylaminoacyl peptidase